MRIRTMLCVSSKQMFHFMLCSVMCYSCLSAYSLVITFALDLPCSYWAFSVFYIYSAIFWRKKVKPIRLHCITDLQLFLRCLFSFPDLVPALSPVL